MTTYKKRREILKLILPGLAIPLLRPIMTFASNEAGNINTKIIPASGEKIPIIGMGTWQTFNVGSDPVLRNNRMTVLKTFFDDGGKLVDCSPMYGSSADTLGFAIKQLGEPEKLFAADKVWTQENSVALRETQEQARRWQIRQIDLMQVHNLVNWQDHLPRLQQMKAEGHIRYVGITTSHGRRHSELASIMKKESIDFVQLTYNMTHREAEQHLLPLAMKKGIAVIANRPYDGGYLIKSLKRAHKLPEWAASELGCQTWADYLLKFVVSHPGVTCAIPATSKVSHMKENMSAAYGLLPNDKQRKIMIREMENL